MTISYGLKMTLSWRWSRSPRVFHCDAELLCPAYIDIHVHGGAGVDVMDDAPDTLDLLAKHKAREGVANWLPTTVTAPLAEIHAALERIARRVHAGGPGAQILGSYLEGPYFTPPHKGAHPAQWFRELDLAEFDRLIAVSRETLRVVALAPEKRGTAGDPSSQTARRAGDAGA